MLRRLSSLTLILLACILAACGGAAPQLIGSYPSTDAGNTYQSPSNIGQDYQISYDTAMTLEVENVYFFNIINSIIARQFEAEVVSSRSWDEGGDHFEEFVIVVPSHRFNEFRDWLRERGTIVAETTFAHVQVSDFGGSSSYYSTITLTVKPYGWVKFRNFAIGVFWFLVVLIPPILMIIGLITVIRWVAGRFKRREPIA